MALSTMWAHAEKRQDRLFGDPAVFDPDGRISFFLGVSHAFPSIMKFMSLRISSGSEAMISSSGIAASLEKMFARDTYWLSFDFRFSVSLSAVTSSTLLLQLSTISKNYSTFVMLLIFISYPLFAVRIITAVYRPFALLYEYI